jgi:DMSO/TMAO reductase YedYZ molybdopterin-dependent catalytic subunit
MAVERVSDTVRPIVLDDAAKARRVVAGYYGAYGMKRLKMITALDAPLDNFWMKSAYRM